MKTYLLTGAAGFIASKTAEELLKAGHRVVGIDNMNDYYDVNIKRYRLKALRRHPRFIFREKDIEDLKGLKKIFQTYKFNAILNLAARAGVRYSMSHPQVYFTTNALGTLNLLELAKEHGVKKFVLSSTSSLYAGQKMPFDEKLPVNTPISPYAASKKAAEAACYTYHYLYGIDVTILRYFTVYGPAGRPDMSVFIFMKKIDEGTTMEVFGDGLQSRDFTYVDDIAKGTVKGLKKVGFKVINLGGNHPHGLMDMVALIEKNLDKKAKIAYKPFHKADIKATWANISQAKKILGWRPRVSLEDGIRLTAEWYLKNKSWLKKIEI